MQEICEALIVSAGALYRCFPTKDSIIVAFAEEERAEAAKLISHLDSSPNIVAALTQIVPELGFGAIRAWRQRNRPSHSPCTHQTYKGLIAASGRARARRQPSAK